MTETKIIRRCLRGDRRAQQSFYQDHAAWLMGLCMRYAPDPATAKDLTQETFLRVFERLGQYDPQRGTLRSWMGRIAVNFCLKRLKRDQRMISFGDELPGPVPEVEPTVLDQLDAEDCLRLLQQLPEGYRIVFSLYVVEGYAHKEISQLLGISESASRSQLARAKQQLRRLILNRKKSELCHSAIG